MLHALSKRLERRKVSVNDGGKHCRCNLRVVGVRGSVAALNHLHPDLAVVDQARLERLACGVFGAVEVLHAALSQKVPHRPPREFVRVLERLDQPLLFEFREFALSGQLDRFLQLGERLDKVVEASHPAAVWLVHRVSPCETDCTRCGCDGRACPAGSSSVRSAAGDGAW